MMNSKEIVESYITDKDWRVKENSNSHKSIGALGKYMSGEISKDYWLREVYNPANPDIAKAYLEGYMHLHDLSSGLTLYCCGYSLKDIIDRGVRGLTNIAVSNPAKHFASILNQLANLTGIFQNEIAGAVAFSSVDTLLAPFIKKDNLEYSEVKQQLQNFIFSINSNSRAGAEPAFSNITLDITPPKDLLYLPANIGGVPQEFTYADCQKEQDMFCRAFCELMIEGDAAGRPFAYPIPTYNIHERFDWDNPNNDLLWEMAGKYGIPYFANYIGSDMDPSDARSMCCRLRLDMRELRKRNGGLFGSGDSTGSIGVVTLNLPRIAYVAAQEIRDAQSYQDDDMYIKSVKNRFYTILSHYMDLAAESLIIKREYLQKNILEGNLIPAFKEYVGTLDNHFNTIGLVGMNEMCINLYGDEKYDILSEEGKAFSVEVLDFMREKLSDYQEETSQLFNLEATPAESTCYRLAMKDVAEFGEKCYHQGNMDAPYYTNSCHMPVKNLSSLKELFDHQNDLQVKFTGGTVVHVYLEGPISGEQAKSVVRAICTNYRVPYISLSPLNTICPNHGLLMQSADRCPECGEETEKFQRITGYIRNTKYFNAGKYAEFEDRNQMKI